MLRSVVVPVLVSVEVGVVVPVVVVVVVADVVIEVVLVEVIDVVCELVIVVDGEVVLLVVGVDEIEVVAVVVGVLSEQSAKVPSMYEAPASLSLSTVAWHSAMVPIDTRPPGSQTIGATGDAPPV